MEPMEQPEDYALSQEVVFKELERAGISKERAEFYEIDSLLEQLMLLRFGMPRCNFRGALEHIIHSVEGAHELKKRLLAEISFYENLFKQPAHKKFGISLKKTHVWPDGCKDYFLIAFECPPGKPIGYTRFSSHGNEFKIELVQGEKGTDVLAANKRLGKSWFNVLMERVIESYRPLHAIGVPLTQFVSDPRAILPKEIRRKYFERYPKISFGTNFLNLQKKRVQRLLRQR